MLKQIALRISVLGESDRAWLMAELSDAELQKLRPVLAEISELGLNRDSVVLEVLPADNALSTGNVAAPPSRETIDHDEWAQLPAFWRDVILPGAGAADTEQSFHELIQEPVERAAKLRQCVIETLVSARGHRHG